MINISLVNLGCARNLVDSETLLYYIKQNGFNIVEEVEKAQIAIINTCAFIDEAKQESIDVILQAAHLKQKEDLKYLVVTGCLVQRYPKILYRQIEQIDALVSPFYYTEIGEIIRQVLKGDRLIKVGNPGVALKFFGKRYPLTSHSFTYLKISEGCNNCCSYCSIPSVRGAYKSRDKYSLLKELEYLHTLMPEMKEVSLIGQDTTLYGHREGYTLINLLRAISEYDYVKWIRILYSHPKHFSQKLIKEISDNSKICNYVDLPVQHISDKILNMMNRDISKDKIIRLIDKIRNFIPEIAIRTTLIVGFPNETTDDFKQLVDFVKKMKFDKLGIFIYSREEETKAYSFSGQVSDKEKFKRYNHLMQIQQEISVQNLNKFLDKKLDILIDEVSKKDDKYECIGRTEFDAPEVDGQVFVYSDEAKVGEIRKVKITDTLEYDLVGEEIKSTSK